MNGTVSYAESAKQAVAAELSVWQQRVLRDVDTDRPCDEVIHCLNWALPFVHDVQVSAEQVSTAMALLEDACDHNCQQNNSRTRGRDRLLTVSAFVGLINM